MTYVEAAVAIVAVLCAFNLLLSFGVIRRLRQHTEQLNQLSPHDLAPGLRAGEQVGRFTATATTGESLSRESLAEQTLVGFFSPGCQPCATQLPAFIARARTIPGGASRALAVVASAGAGDEADYVDRLAPVTRVVVEGHQGALQSAFKNTGFPMIYLIAGDGTILASGFTVEEVAGALTPATAAA